MRSRVEDLAAHVPALLEPAIRAAAANARAIGIVATEIVNRVEHGGRLFAFGAGHAYAFAAELCSRAGGVPNWTSMNLDDLREDARPAHLQLRDSLPEREPANGPALAAFHGLSDNDVLVIASQSGRNGSQVEMALWARAHGVYVVAVLSAVHAAAFASRHPSGLKLGEVADLVLDLCTPVGDAVLEDRYGRMVSATSTLSFALLAQLLNARVVAEMESRGLDAQVIVSANVDRPAP